MVSRLAAMSRSAAAIWTSRSSSRLTASMYRWVAWVAAVRASVTAARRSSISAAPAGAAFAAASASATATTTGHRRPIFDIDNTNHSDHTVRGHKARGRRPPEPPRRPSAREWPTPSV